MPTNGRPPGWEQPGFDDSGWPVSLAAFGSGGGCPAQANVKTFWPGGKELLFRRTINLPPGTTSVEVGSAKDDSVDVWWNGQYIGGHLGFGCAAYDQFIRPVPQSAILAGANEIAVAATDYGGERFLDVTVRAVCPNGCPLLPEETYGACNPSEPHRCQAEAGDPVNTATGNFYEDFTDLTVPGRGVPLAFTRTYNSLAAADNAPLGYGWSHSFMTSLLVTGNLVTVGQENGSQIFFTLFNGVYVPPPRVAASLVHNGDGTWTLTRRAREFLTFDAAGRLIKLEDLNGRAAVPPYATTLSYDGSGRLVTVTDPANRTLTLAYWPSGLLKSVTDSASPSRSVNFLYNDGQGNLTDVTDAAGGVTRMTYDSAHRMLTLLDPNQDGSPTPVPLAIHYDGEGRVDWQKDQLERQTTFDYTTIPGSTLVTDPKENKTLHQYENGMLVAETRGYGTPQAATWEYGYDPDGTLGVSSVTDPNGHVVTSEYDAQGNLTRRTVAPGGLNRVTEYTYTSLNGLETITDAEGVTTTMTYVNGNVTSMSTPLYASDGQTVIATKATSYGYGDAAHPGDVRTITDPNGKIWTFTYDAAGDLATSTDPLGNETAFCYDSIGRRTRLVTPKGTTGFSCPGSPPDPPGPYTTTFSYDALSRLLVTADALNHKIIRTYDANGNLKTLTDAIGNLTEYDYDLANQLAVVTRADDTTQGYEYWPDGKLKSQVDGANQATSYAYDALARLISVTDPLNRATGYSYDAVGNLLQKTSPGGSCSAPASGCTTFGYNAANELKTISYSDGTTPNVTNIDYDKLGQRTAMTDGTGTSAYTWDSLRRLTESKDGAGNTVGYGYDLKGQLTSILYPGQTQPVIRTYDNAGRLLKVRDWLNNETTFDHDANSNLDLITYPNGTTGDHDSDTVDRLTSITDRQGTSGPIFASFTYTRDNANQIKTLTPTGVTQSNETYGYTALNQVQSVNASTYSYDAADNLTGLPSGKTLVYDAANQLTAVSEPISFVGSGANADATGAATSITVNLSAAPQANDQVLLAVDYKQGQNPMPPAGYTTVGTFSGSGSQDSRLRLYRKTATGSEGTSIQVTFNATPVHTKAAAAVVYRGVDPASPIDVVGTAGTAAAATSVTAPSITTTNAGEQLLMVMNALGPVGALGAAWTAPAGMIKRVQSGPNIPAVALAIADKTLGSAGATGNQTATLSTAEDLIGIQIALKTPPPAIVYFHRDELGSTRLLTNSTGSVVATYTFDAYGNPTAKTGMATTPLQYAGQYTDSETGFQYLRARYYDSATAQFLTRDPLETLTRQAYGYVFGNPLNASDPSGLGFCLLGHNPNGSCRGSNIANDLKVVAAVTGAAALVVATAGVAAPGLAIAGYSAATVTTALGVTSTVAASGVAYFDCRERWDINCAASIAEAAGGAVTTGIGAVTGATRPLVSLLSGWLGYGFDVAAFYPIQEEC